MPIKNARFSAIGRANERVARVAGTGLIALDDVRVSDIGDRFVDLGGSCGNVLTALGLLGHAVNPLARLGADRAGALLLEELERANCSLEYVRIDPQIRTPIIVEHLDIETGSHTFAFNDPETGEQLPTYAPIDDEDYEQARDTIERTEVFYCDRVSSSTVRAMETAAEASAIVFFEPSSKRVDASLLKRAIKAASIVKMSDATSAAVIDRALMSACPIVVTTHGKRGLTLRTERGAVEIGPVSPPRLIDTCGAGDMLSAGLINHLLQLGVGEDMCHGDVIEGLRAGMRLAAINCAFVGARGIFRAFESKSISNSVQCGDYDHLAVQAMRLPPNVASPSVAECLHSAAVE